MSIKAAIIEKNQGNDVEKSEYTNLIMDDMVIQMISDEDKTFLEDFQECQFLSFNSTSLKSIENLPKMQKLERLELNDNSLEGGFDIIAKQYPGLKCLKISNNKIKDLALIAPLAACTHLESLDLSNNPCSTDPSLKDGEEQIIDSSSMAAYKAKVRELLPTLEVLDGFNKKGDEVVSDEDETEPNDEEGMDDDFMDEDGEAEMEEGYDEEEEAEGTKATGEQSETGDPTEAKKQKVGEEVPAAEKPEKTS